MIYSINLRAKVSIIVPHHTDQPHPTRQKMIVKACEIPTIQLMMKLPSRPLAPSCCEKRGIPMQRQKNPLMIVPEGKEVEMLVTSMILFYLFLAEKCCK